MARRNIAQATKSLPAIRLAEREENIARLFCGWEKVVYMRRACSFPYPVSAHSTALKAS